MKPSPKTWCRTLLAAFQAKERFSGESSGRSWLTGIFRHKILDHFRRPKREQTMTACDALPAELEDRFDDLGLWKHDPEIGPADWGADAGAQMERKEIMAALKQCLAKLPPCCADAFVLREMKGTDSERIQELLGICSRGGRLCFARALWNGRNPILKERLFGLTARRAITART